MLLAGGAYAQTCTTQARLSAVRREAIAGAAMSLATAVQAGDAAAVRSSTIAQYAADFSASEFLIHATANHISGDTVAVTAVYALDASAAKPSDGGAVEFSCPLAGSPAEVDFAIPGLPPGSYGFATVEATGAHPWLLSFLLSESGGKWLMAGFYPHARAAAGHDGLWYWNSARASVAAGQKWAGWLQYGEADALLRPANFVTSSNLDRLRAEQHAAAPPELSAGVNADTPLVISSPSGEFHITSLSTEGSDDGSRLNIILHMRTDSGADAKSTRARNAAAAAALVDAHPELRKVFAAVWVYADTSLSTPFATEHPMVELP